MKITMLSLCGVLFALSACGGGDGDEGSNASSPSEEPTSAAPNALEATYEPCLNDLMGNLIGEFGTDAQPAGDFFTLEDDGTALLVDPPEEAGAAPLVYDAVKCVLDATGAPAVVEQRLGATVPTGERQSETWDNITFDWSATRDGSIPELTASFVIS